MNPRVSIFIVSILALRIGSAAAQERDSLPISVPLHVSERIPFVTVGVDGIAFRLRFDTGAYESGIDLTSEEMSRAGVTVTGISHVSDVMGNVLERRAFKIAEMRLGSLTLRGVAGNEFRFMPDRPPPGRTGHVGLASLKSYLLVVNFQRGELEVRATGDFAPECGAAESKIVVGDHGIASEFQTGSGSLLLGWDSAAQANILKPTAIGLGEDQFEIGELRQLLGAIGAGEQSTAAFRLVDIQVPGLDGLLGYDYFAGHVVCLDLPAGRVRAKKVLP